jgi:hypothetical protein
MPPVYTTPLINTRLNDVKTTIDAGGGPGFCNFRDGSNALLAACVMQGPPCGAVAGGVLTFATPWTAAQAVATGVPATAQITDSTGTLVISGLTVGTTPALFDIVMSEPQLTVGKTVIIQSATITGH